MGDHALDEVDVRLRDLLTKQFCVVVPVGEDWSINTSSWENNELLGLGLSVVNQYEYEQGLMVLYKYDIATYKKTPEWLNADNWANPQFWDK